MVLKTEAAPHKLHTHTSLESSLALAGISLVRAGDGQLSWVAGMTVLVDGDARKSSTTIHHHKVVRKFKAEYHTELIPPLY